MTNPTRRTSGAVWRTVVVMLVSALLAIPAILLGAGPASAHTRLVSSNPANGASLSAAPAQVVLTFDEVPTVTSLRAQNTDGDLVPLGAPVQSGSTVSVSWPAGSAPGLFRLVYSLVSDDGDPVEGTLIFSYAASGTPAAAQAAAAAGGTGTTDASSSMQLAWLALAGLLVGASGALVVVTRRRARPGSLDARELDTTRHRVRTDV